MTKDALFIAGLSALIGSQEDFFLRWVMTSLIIIDIFTCFKRHTFYFQALFSLIVVMVLPFLIATSNLAKSPSLYVFEYGRFTNIILKTLAFPLLPFILISLELQTEFQVRFGHGENSKELIQRYKDLKAQTSAFIRTELGMETTPQLIISLLLLLISSSNTRTIYGLELFDDTRSDNVTETIGIDPIYLIISANCWSLFSSWRSFIKGLSATKDHFPFLAQIILLIYVLMAVGTKVLSSHLFLMPTLGIGNCLRHYQGEHYPYWAAMGPHIRTEEWSSMQHTQQPSFNYTVDIEKDLVYFSNITFRWSELTRFDYSNKTHPIAPPVTIYTYFELETYLITFWIIYVVQAFLIIFAKRITNPDIFEKLEWNVILTNTLENIWIQAPLEDWDDMASTIPGYKRKQTKNMIEMASVLFINMVTSISMLTPIWILRK